MALLFVLKTQHGFSLVALYAEFYCTGSTITRLGKQGCAQGKTDVVKKICVASQNLVRLVWASRSQNKTVVQGQEFRDREGWRNSKYSTEVEATGLGKILDLVRETMCLASQTTGWCWKRKWDGKTLEQRQQRISRKGCLRPGSGWRLKVSSNEIPICSDFWFSININSWPKILL